MARPRKNQELPPEDEFLKLPPEQLLLKFRKLERANALYRQEAAFEKQMRAQAEGEAEVARKKFDLMLVTTPRDPLEPIRVVPTGKTSCSVPLLCLTDWHYEEVVRPETVNGRNEYNPAIAKKRAEHVLSNAVKLLQLFQDRWPIMLLWLGGDFINGYIHKEFRATNAMSPAQAILEVQDILIRGIDYLKKELGIRNLLVVTSCGNHSRPGEEKEISTAIENSYEFIMYHNLARHYRGQSWFEIDVGLSYHNYVSLFDMVLRFQHGDAIKYGGGVGGISIPVNKAIAAWNEDTRARYDIFGHFHQYKWDENFVSCGCLIGRNQYAIRIKAKPSRPSQPLMLFNREHEMWLNLGVHADVAYQDRQTILRHLKAA